MDFKQIRKVLVTKLRHHGDVLLASPVFQTLKNRHPHLHIDALVYRDTQDMLTGHPAVTTVHTIDRTWKKQGLFVQGRAEWRLLRTLRRERYDLLLHLTEHRRGAWLQGLAGIPQACTLAVPGRGRFWQRAFTHTVAPARGGGRHTVEVNLDHLRVLGVFPEPAERRLVLVPGAGAETQVDTLLKNAGLHAQRFVHVHPGSRWSFKCWPVEKMAALLDQLRTAGVPVVLTAAPDSVELSMVAQIKTRLAGPVALDLSGQLSLKELAALTQRAALFVGVDSAPMHIAAAMRTRTVALFGPSGPTMWGPWEPVLDGFHTVLTSDRHPCQPCGRDGCGGGKVSDCLVSLPVARVLAAVLADLSQSNHTYLNFDKKSAPI
ncbi:MAG: putative lipopolysaccharide heptosyltransferase III [Burkholderiaceae bacterium]